MTLADGRTLAYCEWCDRLTDRQSPRISTSITSTNLTESY
jgi:hypothetical protein